MSSFSHRARLLGALLLFAVAFGWLYREVFAALVRDWWSDENYSHGFLVVPLAAYFVWTKRRALEAAPLAPSVAGLAVMVGSVGLLLAGVLGAELFVARVSILGVVAGAVLFVAGWKHLRLLALPILFLLLMIPLPAIIFNQVAFPLQLLASRCGEVTLSALQIPVLREGNVITLANTTLEVAEACSGIRSLISLVTLAIVYGYFAEPRRWARVLLAIAAVPVAVISNGVRVAGTGVAAHFYGPAAAEGFLHAFSGWLLFILAFAMLMGIERLLGLVPVRVDAALGAEA